MSGISALYRYGEIEQDDLSRLEAMNREMKYRGTDAQGVWSQDNVALAQIEMQIIGDKITVPLINGDQTLVLAFDGRIYNYLELRQRLNEQGISCNTNLDKEVVLHLYSLYGADCLSHIRGEFAFVLFDKNKNQLFVARDRIGLRTLYYSAIPGAYLFSTELKAILKNFIHKPQVNLERLSEPIRYTSPLHKSETYIEQIKRLEPGHFAIIDNNGIYIKQYWNRKSIAKKIDSAEIAKKETLRLLRESVELNLQSDVPLAVMLSGGIDSSAIAALAKETGKEIHTITAGYKGQHDCDERAVARKFAKERGFVYHEVELDENDFIEHFEELTQYLDEPITDAAAIAQWATYKKVNDLGFKVLLGGMGGDELFYGYPYWNSMAESLYKHRYHQSLFPWRGIKKKREFLQFLYKNIRYVLFAGYPMKIEDSSIGFWQYDDYKKFVSDATLFFQNEILHFSEISLNKSFGNAVLGSEIDLVYDFSFDNIMTMAYLYLSDRLGAGNSIEIRSPFLDYKLVEYVSSLPLDVKYDKQEPKGFLKDVLRGIVPDYILYAKKRGFTPPTDFIHNVVNTHQYKMFQSKHKYYNSILADRVLSLNLEI